MKKKLFILIGVLLLLNMAPLKSEANWEPYFLRIYSNTSNWSYFTSLHTTRIHYVDIYSYSEQKSRAGTKKCENTLSTTGYIYTPRGFAHRKRGLKNTSLSCFK